MGMGDRALPEYEYRGLMAEAWDLLRGDTSQWPDRAFYRALIAQAGEPALDIGCGTGRLLLDYLADGIDIDGLDNSPEMLAICRAKAAVLGLRPTLFNQYVETLALPRRYRTVLIPSSSLQLITDLATAEEALRRIAAHMEPGGVLAASLMTLWRAGEPLESQWEQSATRPEDGAVLRRVAWSRYDPATACEETEDAYELIVGGQVVRAERLRRSPATRSYTQQEARDLFARAGFAQVTLHQAFSWAPAQPDETLFVAIGRV